MILWSLAAKLAYVVELTLSPDDGVEGAYERKRNKYSDLAAEAFQTAGRPASSQYRLDADYGPGPRIWDNGYTVEPLCRITKTLMKQGDIPALPLSPLQTGCYH